MKKFHNWGFQYLLRMIYFVKTRFIYTVRYMYSKNTPPRVNNWFLGRIDEILNFKNKNKVFWPILCPAISLLKWFLLNKNLKSLHAIILQVFWLVFWRQGLYHVNWIHLGFTYHVSLFDGKFHRSRIKFADEKFRPYKLFDWFYTNQESKKHM